MSAKRPYGLRGDFVVEQRDPSTDVWSAIVGAMTKEKAREKARLYPGEKRVTPNHPGAPLREGSWRP